MKTTNQLIITGLAITAGYYFIYLSVQTPKPRQGNDYEQKIYNLETQLDTYEDEYEELETLTEELLTQIKQLNHQLKKFHIIAFSK